MLISSMILAHGGQGADLAVCSRIVVETLASSWDCAPAMRCGLESELVGLFKRLCTPLKSAIEHQYADADEMELGAWMRQHLQRCPVLDRALYQQAQQLIDEFVTLNQRFRVDGAELASVGLLMRDSVLTSARIASADKHHGEHVLKLDFSIGSSLYYKPRSGAGAILLKKLSGLMGTWGLPLGAPDVLARDGYHWMAEVPYVGSCSSEVARQFAHAGGVLYAIASTLNASDLHFENLIATIEGPVVVDCETMCQPRFSTDAAAYLLKRPRDEHDDVTSLFLNFDRYGGQDIDYGGLSCVDVLFRADPNAGIQVPLSWERRQLVLYQSRSAIEVNGRRIAPAIEYFPAFAQGIREASACIREHQDDVLALVCPQAMFRVPLRATRVYGALIGERMSAICFSSYAADNWGAHLEADLKDAPATLHSAARAILELETIDLAQLDIPAAYVEAGSRDLLLRGTRIKGIFDMSPREVIQARLRNLSRTSIDKRIAKLGARLVNYRRLSNEAAGSCATNVSAAETSST